MAKELTPMKAIRKKCLDCCCGQHVEVRLCKIEDCPLWVYRMGHRPKQDGDNIMDESFQVFLDTEIP